MKNRFIAIFTLGILVISCAEAQSETEPTTDNQNETEVIVEEVVSGEESTEVSFMGVEKDDHLLYGHTDITIDDAISSAEMFTKFENEGIFNGKVIVNINEVCQKAGCWINIEKSGDDNVMVFFRDHYTIPIESSAGKEAILYGSLISDTLSIEFQKHLLDDAAEAGETVEQSAYDAITEDKIDMSFDCESILIKK